MTASEQPASPDQIPPELIVERRGEAGIVTLNRPAALNAITHGMVATLATVLAAWAEDTSVSRVIVKAAGEKAFSAGGDIRALYELIKTGRSDRALAFWREEYALNQLIKRYPKPYVALVDGIVMGGGAGVSINGSHVVAGERLAFAMPEAGIGFFPDVGATYFLGRMPGEYGTYIALTGKRLKQGDALATGLVTHAVPSARMDELCEALTRPGSVDAILEAFAGPATLAPGITGHRGSIERCFRFDTVEAILDALDRDARALDAWCAETAATIRTKSPTSLKIALEQVRRGRKADFEQAMAIEFRIVSRIVQGHDFLEGTRAAIIDKDQSPRWRPATLAEVTRTRVEAYFAALPGAELELPGAVTVSDARR